MAKGWVQQYRGNLMTSELRAARRKIATMRADYPVDTTWLHEKSGGLYWIQAHALNEADLSPVVIYRCKKTGTAWCRPAAEFADGRFIGPVGLEE